MAATSVFPYFTSPRLCSPLQCLPAVMDGWFPGKGSGMLPVPDRKGRLEVASPVVVLAGNAAHQATSEKPNSTQFKQLRART